MAATAVLNWKTEGLRQHNRWCIPGLHAAVRLLLTGLDKSEGNGDLGRPVQSISSFVNCILPVSVREMLGLCLLGKWAFLVLAAMFQLFLLRLIKNDYVTGAVFF